MLASRYTERSFATTSEPLAKTVRIFAKPLNREVNTLAVYASEDSIRFVRLDIFFIACSFL